MDHPNLTAQTRAERFRSDLNWMESLENGNRSRKSCNRAPRECRRRLLRPWITPCITSPGGQLTRKTAPSPSNLLRQRLFCELRLRRL